MDIRGILSDFFSNNEKVSLLGGIPLEVIAEKSIDSMMTIPTKRVENGFNISDSLRKDPLVFDITVVDNSPSYMNNRAELFALQEKGELVEFYFSGRDTYENIAVESITEIESNEQAKGFTYHITLRQIQIAEISESDVQLDAKSANTTGGKKTRTTAKTTDVSKAEKAKVDKVASKPRGKTTLYGIVDGFKGG